MSDIKHTGGQPRLRTHGAATPGAVTPGASAPGVSAPGATNPGASGRGPATSTALGWAALSPPMMAAERQLTAVNLRSQ